jgi:hypothetical protein
VICNLEPPEGFVSEVGPEVIGEKNEVDDKVSNNENK